MKRFSLSAFLIMLVGMLSCTFAYAQETSRPIFHVYDFEDGGIMQNISNNGKWAVVEQALTGDGLTTKPKLVNLETDEITNLIPSIDACKNCTAKDVTDDGTIVVGSYDDLPAYWSKAIGDWEFLELAEYWEGGEVLAVTPDGKYAVGKLAGEQVPVMNEDGTVKTEKNPFTGEITIVRETKTWNYKATMWDLETGKIVELEGLPELDRAHEYITASSFDGISPDGRYLLEAISWFYPLQNAFCVYDCVEKSYKMIGYTEHDNAVWTPIYTGLDNLDNLKMSANGVWVSGSAVTYGGSYLFRYNVLTEKFEVLDGANDANFEVCIADGEGNMFSATTVAGPLRELVIRKDGLWYDFRKMLSNIYGLDFEAYVGLDYTGTPFALSEDGTKLVSMSSVYDQSYVVEFDHPVIEECAKLNLLDLYTVSPASGVSFSTLQQIYLTFEYDVEVLASGKSIELKDENGNVVRNSLTFATATDNAKSVRIAFRTQTLDAGKKYTVTLPAGALCVKGDRSRVNKKIELEYIGRENKPIEMVSAFPESGSSVAKIDYSSSYITLTMDADIAVTDSASAALYRVEGDKEYRLGDLSFLTNKNQVALYPSGILYMYEGSVYKIVVEKGSISDAAKSSASNTNDEFSIIYNGAYVREIEQTDRVLFNCDFQDLSGALIDLFMFYDGDNNTLSDEFKNLDGWDLNSSWNLSIRDEGSTDACAMSVSSYNPAGKSDDWMVIPRLSIPDDMCVLSFDAQSYYNNKTDRLKVYIWECDEEINVLNQDIVERIKAEGTLAFNEVLSPGASEQTLAGDWTNYSVDLKEYAEKNIYIAFLNDNEDQSAVFVDNVIVQRDLRYSIALITENAVVAKENQAISGIFTVTSAVEKYNKITLTLKDGEGAVIDEIAHTSETAMAQGENFRFDFKPLSLLVGKKNDFTIEVNLAGTNSTGNAVAVTDVVNSSISNLMFETTKRVVLEEYTGEACPNCPRGILAIENMEHIVGDKLIPIAIHTYAGDRYSTPGMQDYSDFLNLNAAPSGRVNRNYISSPMYANEQTGVVSFAGEEGNKTWLDYVQEELATSAVVNVNVAPVATNGVSGQLEVPVTVRYALDATDVNVNIFAVVLQDKLPGVQSNNLGSSDLSIYGEWGKGGKYEGSSVAMFYKDVARYCITAFGGAQGLLPQNMEAGKDYTATITVDFPQVIKSLSNVKVAVMLIDANTDRVLNAACAPIIDAVGINGVNTDEDVIAVSATEGNVTVIASDNVRAELYSTSGQLISIAEGNGTVSVDANGYKGIAVVKVVTSNGTVAKKIMVK